MVYTRRIFPLTSPVCCSTGMQVTNDAGLAPAAAQQVEFLPSVGHQAGPRMRHGDGAGGRRYRQPCTTAPPKILRLMSLVKML